MLLSIILCVCILFIVVGLLFFMETEGGWDFAAVFSGDELDLHTEKPESHIVRKGSTPALIHTIPAAEISLPSVPSEAVYQNMMDCRVLTSSYDLHESGQNVECCGYGSCVRMCPQQAIVIVKGKAVISENCNGCGICVDCCPLHLISLLNADSQVSAENTENSVPKKLSFSYKFWRFWYTILKRDEADGSIALWE